VHLPAAPGVPPESDVPPVAGLPPVLDVPPESDVPPEAVAPPVPVAGEVSVQPPQQMPTSASSEISCQRFVVLIEEYASVACE
jgi:hypothetical protein